jgi:hypothetical protein
MATLIITGFTAVPLALLVWDLATRSRRTPASDPFAGQPRRPAGSPTA